MKRSIKFMMVAALALGSTSLFAQKFARVDYQGILPLMPEMATVQSDIQKIYNDYSEHIESMSVERNKKIDEISKLPESTSETTKQLKNREVMDISQRIEEYTRGAEEGLAKAQMDLLLPLKTKLDAAVKKVCKAQGITAAFQTMSPENVQMEGQMVYIDEDTTPDITMAVRSELGIPANATPPTTAR